MPDTQQRDRLPGAPEVAINTPFITAQPVTRPRDLHVVMKRCIDEAQISGDVFYYRWEVESEDKKTGRKKKSYIQGPSIWLATALIRNYGNSMVQQRPVQETRTAWIFTAAAIDLETGYTIERQYRMDKGFVIYGKMDKFRKDDIRFQIGQSKAIRNVVMNFCPRGIAEKMLEAARNSVRDQIVDAIRIANGDKGAVIDKMLKRFEKQVVSVEDIERKYEIPRDAWDIELLTLLYGDLRALESGAETKSSLYAEDEPESGNGPQKSKLDPSKFKNGDPSTHQNHQEAAASANGNGGQSETGPVSGKAKLAELKESLRGVLEYMQKLLDDDKVPGSQHEAVRSVIAGGREMLDQDVSADRLCKNLNSCQGWVEWIESQQPKGPPDDLPGPPTDNENDLPSPPESSPGPSEESSPEATTNGDEDPGDQAAAERDVRAERQAELLKLNRSALVAKANTTFGKVDMADESFNGEQFIIKACQTGILNHHVFGNKKNTEEHLAVFIIECEALLETTGGANGVPPKNKRTGV